MCPSPPLPPFAGCTAQMSALLMRQESNTIEAKLRSLYLGFFMSVVTKPAIGFAEVIKDVHPPLGAAGLQHNGGGRVHLSADPAAVEDVEDHHAEEEQGSYKAHIPRQLLSAVAEHVKDAQKRCLCCCRLLAGPLHVQDHS